MRDDKVLTHPVQTAGTYYGKKQGRVPQVVTMKAYEVYCHLFSPQEALITGECRGGFGAGELIALLYAANFPKAEWNKRFDEAIRGMEDV